MVQCLKHQHLLLPAFGFMDLVFSVPSLAAAAAPATHAAPLAPQGIPSQPPRP